MKKENKGGYASRPDDSNPEYIKDYNNAIGLCPQWIPPRPEQQIINMNERISYIIRTTKKECPKDRE